MPFFKREGDRWKPGAAPKPLPFPHILAAQPEARVWVTEGEKCAVAVQRLASVAVTSQGGSSAAGKADWSPLRGRRAIRLAATTIRQASTTGGTCCGLLLRRGQRAWRFGHRRAESRRWWRRGGLARTASGGDTS